MDNNNYTFTLTLHTELLNLILLQRPIGSDMKIQSKSPSARIVKDHP